MISKIFIPGEGAVKSLKEMPARTEAAIRFFSVRDEECQDQHQMLTNANKCKRKDGSGLKRTVFRDTVFYFMVKITSVNLNISGHI